MHNPFEKHDNIHRDAIHPWALLGYISSLKTIMPSYSVDPALKVLREYRLHSTEKHIIFQSSLMIKHKADLTP
jgi:hypothetical protein